MCRKSHVCLLWNQGDCRFLELCQSLPADGRLQRAEQGQDELREDESVSRLGLGWGKMGWGKDESGQPRLGSGVGPA